MTEPDMTSRAVFARLVTLVLTVSTRAIDQALDPKEPPLSAEAVRNYTATVRQSLDLIEEHIIEYPEEPKSC